MSAATGDLKLEGNIDATGNLTASNALFDNYAEAKTLRQTVLTIDLNNLHKYATYNIITVEGGILGCIDLYLDGSLHADAEKASHVVLDFDAHTSTTSNLNAFFPRNKTSSQKDVFFASQYFFFYRLSYL